MKTIFTTIFLWVYLFVSIAGASTCIVVRRGVVGDHCDSCPDAANGADVRCEDFEGTGYLCTGWAETIDGANSIDKDAAHSGALSCTDKGSGAFEFTIDESGGETGEDARAQVTITATGTLHKVYYFNIVSEDLVDGEQIGLMDFRSGGTFVAGISFIHTSGNLRTYTQWRKDDDTNQYSLGGTNIVVGTCYKLDVSYISGTSVDVELNDVSQTAISANVKTLDVTIIGIGAHDILSGATGKTVVVQLDNMRWDDDTLPSDCAGWSP